MSERGVFRQHYDTDALDASTLLIPLVRFLPASDERVRKTVLSIADGGGRGLATEAAFYPQRIATRGAP